MQKIKRLVLLAAITGFATVQICSDAAAQVRERARFVLPDVAMATTDRFGRPTVLYNPAKCDLLGPEMCEFVRAHEYGHIALGHLYDGTPDRIAEAEADCWAAKNASPAAVRAASRYFSNGMFGSNIHGSGAQRARRVASCGSKKRVVRKTVNRRVVARSTKLPSTTRSRSFSSPTKVVVRRKLPTTVVRRATPKTVVSRTAVVPARRVVVRRTVVPRTR